ncbi:hypothetical protein H1P_250002 [Hyella patelloides LEGE 07179]|uniref:Uncharacterized protein n=1 Tax=Hyella patelloides LEGE 07179 TaxID=945734 RepID=A0A563VRX7_9CYAN|nr:hypothetical protein [Hyella patelloides]VEP14210.1 hypothetical protein H1P_250002 [Hyella patelloides LEGE 07179]
MNCVNAIALTKRDSEQSGLLSILFDQKLLLEEVENWGIEK